MDSKFDYCEFLKHIKLGNFSVDWDINLPLYSSSSLIQGVVGRCGSSGEQGAQGPQISHKAQGCIGRYGVGYGSEEHRRDIKNKYGINNGNFQLPDSGISLNFVINNAEGYEYICKFADHHQYGRPTLSFNKTREVKPGMIEELRKVIKENDEKKLLVDSLLERLEEIASFSFENLEITSLVSTDEFYNWTQKPVFPFEYEIVERDNERVKNIWFDTNIMRDC